MTTRNAAVYGVGGLLLVACLAAANMPQERDPQALPTSRARRPPDPDAVTMEVQSQATRLRALMERAPVPDQSARNPFSFGASRPSRVASSASSAASAHAGDGVDPTPAFLAPLPVLTLMGVAEDTNPAGLRRTAIIGGDGDTLYMVAEGDAVGDRYRVTKISADAVELEDTLTKAYRRLALR